jgi:DNA-binding transcriptional regulator YbjK
MMHRIRHSHCPWTPVKSPKKSVISARKRPRQRRSEQLVDAILEAAIRVLSREGAQRFTTARVAEAAGVSVGSLYHLAGAAG